MRILSLFAAIACLVCGSVTGQDPPASLLMVVSNNATASMLPPLPDGAKMSVLVRSSTEPEEILHSRAFKLRSATHFVYRSGWESPLGAMYRERLRNHGAVIIDLRTFSQADMSALLKRSEPSEPERSGSLSLANNFSRD